MHRINDAIVRGGQLVLSNLPFAEGEHVEVVVVGHETAEFKRLPIAQVREMLRGGVERYDDPFEPSIPPDGWEMLR